MESITILMDAVSLSNISLGSEVLESLPSSPDVHKHDDEGIEMPLRDPRKKDTVTPTIETERGHKYLRHKDKGYRGMPAEQWMKKDTDRELPATDRVSHSSVHFVSVVIQLVSYSSVRFVSVVIRLVSHSSDYFVSVVIQLVSHSSVRFISVVIRWCPIPVFVSFQLSFGWCLTFKAR